MHVARLLTPLAVMAALSACNGAPTQSGSRAIIAARDQLAASLRQCSETYHYDPRHVEGIGEHALAPNETRWQLCAYDAVRVYEEANPPLAPLYSSLVSQDTLMTAGILHGNVTRSERSARIRALLEKIKAAEDNQIAASKMDEDRQLTQVNDMLRMFQTMSVSTRP